MDLARPEILVCLWRFLWLLKASSHSHFAFIMTFIPRDATMLAALRMINRAALSQTADKIPLPL